MANNLVLIVFSGVFRPACISSFPNVFTKDNEQLQILLFPVQ